MIQDDYTAWLELASPDIQHVQEFMGQPLSDDPNELLLQITEAESWFSRMAFLLAKSTDFLERARGEFLQKKGEGSELDRKTQLDASCADYRRSRNVLESLTDAIKQRVNLGQSILKYQRELNGPKSKQKSTWVDP
jgi:hypothetical protein